MYRPQRITKAYIERTLERVRATVERVRDADARYDAARDEYHFAQTWGALQAADRRVEAAMAAQRKARAANKLAATAYLDIVM